AHAGVSCSRPRKNKTWIVRLATHGIVPRAKRAAENDGDLRYDRIRDRIHHLRAGFNDPAPLCITTDHETVYVVQEYERHQVLVAVHDEASSFFRRFRVDDTAKFHAFAAFMVGRLGMKFLVGDDADRESADPGVATNEGLAILRLIFVKLAGIGDACDYFLDVVWPGRRGVVNAVDFLGCECGRNWLLAVPG